MPYSVNVNYIENYSEDDFKELIKTILKNKANNNTPIIFIYDGHGITETGVMVMDNFLNINNATFINLFSNNKINNKLFIFTQCGSYSFYNSLDKNELPNSVYICSTNKPSICGYGGGILVKYSELLKSKKYVRFNNMKSEIEKDTIFFLDDSNKIKIEDIFKSYKPTFCDNMFNKDDEIYFVAEEHYLGYNITQNRKISGIIKDKKKWFIKDKEYIALEPENEDNKTLCYRFATQELYEYNNSYFNAYLDSYEKNGTNIALWNLNTTDIKKQFFKINSNLTVQSILDNYYLLYDIQQHKFCRGQNISNNLCFVKIKY